MTTDEAPSSIDAATRELERRTDKEYPLPAGPIFHYTTVPGAFGVISSGKIWATHFAHLNDRDELIRGENLVLAAFAALQSDGTFDQYARAAIKAAADAFEKDAPTKKTPVFVASFSESGDLLSQWRAYGGGGQGLSLGFCFRQHLANSTEQPFMLALVQCEYDEKKIVKEATEWSRKIIGVAAELVRGVDPSQVKEFWTQVALVLLRRAAQMNLAYKAHHYRDEREWRLLVMPRDPECTTGVLLRPTHNDLVPYVEVGLSRDEVSLSEIFVGPSLEYELVKNGLGYLLKTAAESSPTKIEKSTIPYRT
jgi:Protein of unknown function (DUF2971)